MQNNIRTSFMQGFLDTYNGLYKNAASVAELEKEIADLSKLLKKYRDLGIVAPKAEISKLHWPRGVPHQNLLYPGLEGVGPISINRPEALQLRKFLYPGLAGAGILSIVDRKIGQRKHE